MTRKIYEPLAKLEGILDTFLALTKHEEIRKEVNALLGEARELAREAEHDAAFWKSQAEASGARSTRQRDLVNLALTTGIFLTPVDKTVLAVSERRGDNLRLYVIRDALRRYGLGLAETKSAVDRWRQSSEAVAFYDDFNTWLVQHSPDDETLAVVHERTSEESAYNALCELARRFVGNTGLGMIIMSSLELDGLITEPGVENLRNLLKRVIR